MMTNKKYEITDIAHEKHPFLHRIRALRDIGKEVKAGDLGGFVEDESNLAFEAWDDSWIFDDAISYEGGYVDKDACLRDRAIVCGQAYVTYSAELTDDARAEDDAYISEAKLSQNARAYGFSMIAKSRTAPKAPVLSGNCVVYGKVYGNVTLTGNVVIASAEVISNHSQNKLTIDDNSRTTVPSREELLPTSMWTEERKKARQKKQAR